MLRVVTEDGDGAEMRSTLDEFVAEAARRMLAAALEPEVDAYIVALADERDEAGRRLVVRNGHARPWQVVTGAGGDPGAGAERQRQESRCRDRGERGPGPQLDPGPVGPQVAEGVGGVGGVAVDVPAREGRRGTSPRRWRSSSALGRGCRPR
jgi:hypothetical protein